MIRPESEKIGDGKLAVVIDHRPGRDGPIEASAPALNASLFMNSLLFTRSDFNSSISLSCDMAFHLREDVASSSVVLSFFHVGSYSRPASLG